jgi:demethylmenaquinone methyltransferase/2-methoxy-6-polyprenyl-1,4-benzoquinol methylase
MASRFFQTGTQRSTRVQELFSTIAPRYDLINDLQSFGLHRRWKRTLVRLAAPRAGEQALDLCCGTGDVTFALAAQGAHAVGLDFSRAMLRIACNRRRRLGTGRHPGSPSAWRQTGSIAFVCGDGLRLPLAGGSFDVVTISYGLRNLPDIEGALRELGRVTRASGRLLVLDFSKPEHRLWRDLYFAYLNAVVPLFGKVLCGDAETYSYILESLRHYPTPAGIAEALDRAGWVGVRGVGLLGGAMTITLAARPGP